MGRELLHLSKRLRVTNATLKNGTKTYLYGKICFNHEMLHEVVGSLVDVEVIVSECEENMADRQKKEKKVTTPEQKPPEPAPVEKKKEPSK